MAEVGSLWVRLLGDTAGFDKSMQSVSKTMASTGERMQEVGGALTRGVTLPLIAIGGASIAAAMTVEEAMATIRAGTGATGEQLATLGEDFRTVFAQVPQAAAEVGTAIADLNTRLGLTGEPLQQLALQMLALADLTGLQVAPLIEKTTRLFGDWSIATENQSTTLDFLWRVAQSTGISVEKLSAGLVQFGAPLRQMGFSLEESAALMGKWEQEGVNMEMVLGSLRIGIAHFAEQGIPLREGLNETISTIQSLGAGAEATALAMEVFGTRAGPDMAAAILEGRFEIESLLAELRNGTETIASADAATETFAEKMQVLKNQVTLAIEPIGVRLVSALEKLIPHITGAFEALTRLTEWFANLSPAGQTAVVVFLAFAVAIGPVVTIIGKLISMTAGVIAFWGAIKVGAAAAKVSVLAFIVAKSLLTLKILAVIAVVALLAAGVNAIIRNWEGLTKFFSNLFNGIINIFKSVIDAIGNIFSAAVEAIAGPFRRAWEIVKGIANKIKEALNAINPFARQSPSLVDNVRAGVKVIQKEYGKLEGMRITPATRIGERLVPQRNQATNEQGMNTNTQPVSQNISIEMDGVTVGRLLLPNLIREGNRIGSNFVVGTGG